MRSVALFALALTLVACRSSRRAIPPPALLDDSRVLVEEAHHMVAKVAKNIPLWETDDLGQFERQEIAKVKADIDDCNSASTDDDYMEFAQRLFEDAAALQAADDALLHEHVI